MNWRYNMVSGYDFFKVQLSIKLHFTTNYDVVKYLGKTKYTYEDYQAKPDKFVFERFGKKCKTVKDVIGLSVANTMFGEKDWVFNDIASALSRYNKWIGTTSALTYNITQDFKFISGLIDTKLKSYDKLLETTKSGNKPPLLQLYLSKRILPDTLVYMDSHEDFLSPWRQEYSNDPMVDQVLFRVQKYKAFIKPKDSELLTQLNDLKNRNDVIVSA